MSYATLDSQQLSAGPGSALMQAQHMFDSESTTTANSTLTRQQFLFETVVQEGSSSAVTVPPTAQMTGLSVRDVVRQRDEAGARFRGSSDLLPEQQAPPRPPKGRAKEPEWLDSEV